MRISSRLSATMVSEMSLRIKTTTHLTTVLNFILCKRKCRARFSHMNAAAVLPQSRSPAFIQNSGCYRSASDHYPPLFNDHFNNYYYYLHSFHFQVWFKNRRAKCRQLQKHQQHHQTNSSGSSATTTTSISTVSSLANIGNSSNASRNSTTCDTNPISALGKMHGLNKIRMKTTPMHNHNNTR